MLGQHEERDTSSYWVVNDASLKSVHARATLALSIYTGLARYQGSMMHSVGKRTLQNSRTKNEVIRLHHDAGGMARWCVFQYPIVEIRCSSIG